MQRTAVQDWKGSWIIHALDTASHGSSLLYRSAPSNTSRYYGPLVFSMVQRKPIETSIPSSKTWKNAHGRKQIVQKSQEGMHSQQPLHKQGRGRPYPSLAVAENASSPGSFAQFASDHVHFSEVLLDGMLVSIFFRVTRRASTLLPMSRFVSTAPLVCKVLQDTAPSNDTFCKTTAK